MHDDFYLRNNSNLIKRHNPLCKIACINEFYNKFRIEKLSLGKKRISNFTSVIANKYMMDISIMIRVFHIDHHSIAHNSCIFNNPTSIR